MANFILKVSKRKIIIGEACEYLYCKNKLLPVMNDIIIYVEAMSNEKNIKIEEIQNVLSEYDARWKNSSRAFRDKIKNNNLRTIEEQKKYELLEKRRNEIYDILKESINYTTLNIENMCETINKLNVILQADSLNNKLKYLMENINSKSEIYINSLNKLLIEYQNNQNDESTKSNK